MIRLFLFPDQYFDIFCYIYKSSLFETGTLKIIFGIFFPVEFFDDPV